MSYVVLPIAARSTERIAPVSAYSGSIEKLSEGAPMFVLPPCPMYMTFVSVSSAMPFVMWSSSERGRPRTTSVGAQRLPVQSRRDRMPEFVSSPVSFATAMRGSDDVTQITGFAGVPRNAGCP